MAPVFQGNQEEKDGEPTVEAQINTYLLESFAAGVEGLMLKPLDVNASYQASKRSENWLKLKKYAALFLPVLCYLHPTNTKPQAPVQAGWLRDWPLCRSSSFT